MTRVLRRLGRGGAHGGEGGHASVVPRNAIGSCALTIYRDSSGSQAGRRFGLAPGQDQGIAVPYHPSPTFTAQDGRSSTHDAGRARSSRCPAGVRVCGPGTAARDLPDRAHGLLLPDARLDLRGRGRGPGDAGPRLEGPRSVRGPGCRSAPGCTGSPPTSASTCSNGRKRRARPMDLGPASTADATLGRAAAARSPGSSRSPTLVASHRTATRPRSPTRGSRSGSRSSPRSSTCRRRQRAVLILREVLRWPAPRSRSCSTRPSRRSTARSSGRAPRSRSADVAGRGEPPSPWTRTQQALLARYVDAFERYDMDSLTSLLTRTRTWNMPPYDLWLQTHEDIAQVVPRTRHRLPAARGSSRPWPTVSPAFGQYKPGPGRRSRSRGRSRCSSCREGRITGITFFLDTERLLPDVRPARPPRRLSRARRQDLAEPRETDEREECVEDHEADRTAHPARHRARPSRAHRWWSGPGRSGAPHRSRRSVGSSGGLDRWARRAGTSSVSSARRRAPRASADPSVSHRRRLFTDEDRRAVRISAAAADRHRLPRPFDR